MNAENMIPYIEAVASQQVPPPYQMPGVTVHGFVWDAQMERIQAYCDRNYNLGDARTRGFVYRPAPIWPYVLLMCIDYPVMISCDPEKRRSRETTERREADRRRLAFSQRGVVSQREVFVALPIMRYGTKGLGVLTDTTLEWALPFIVVENAMSAICGREMLGLEKLLADVTFKTHETPDSFAGVVRLPGWKLAKPTKELQQRDVDTRSLRFLDVTTGPKLPTFRPPPNETSLWSLLRSRAARQAIEAFSSATDFVESVSEGLAPTAMRTVALKQIRDAANAERAIYQAIVGCRSNYSNIEAFRFYNENDVVIQFHKHESFDELLCTILPPAALSGNQSEHDEMLPAGAFRPKAAFTFEADIDFDDMRTVHTFDVDKEPGEPPTEKVGDLTSPWARPWKGFFFGEKTR